MNETRRLPCLLQGARVAAAADTLARALEWLEISFGRLYEVDIRGFGTVTRWGPNPFPRPGKPAIQDGGNRLRPESESAKTSAQIHGALQPAA